MRIHILKTRFTNFGKENYEFNGVANKHLAKSNEDLQLFPHNA